MSTCTCRNAPYRGCGERFSTAKAFDRHRVGIWADRRCLTPTQMVELGLKKDRHNRWAIAGKPNPFTLKDQISNNPD